MEITWRITSLSRTGKLPHNYGTSPFFHGKTHDFYGHLQELFVSHYQRVATGEKVAQARSGITYLGDLLDTPVVDDFTK